MAADRSAIVTGAGRGIGRATALELADADCAVGVFDIDPAPAEAVRDEIRDRGQDAIAIEGDVSDVDAVDRAVETVTQTYDGLDIAVNNAGIQTLRPFLDLPTDELDRVIEVNLRGSFLMAQRAANAMVDTDGPGRIVNVTSVHQELPRDLHTHYDATKAGIRMLTKDMAFELAEAEITVNCVAPGAIATPMNRHLLDDEETMAEVEGMIPAGRFGDPEEIARVIRFLAAPESSYITGACLTVDGGFSLAGLGWD